MNCLKEGEEWMNVWIGRRVGGKKEIMNGARRHLIPNKLQRRGGPGSRQGWIWMFFSLFHSNPRQPCHAALPCPTLALALTLVLVLSLTLLGQGTRGMIVLNTLWTTTQDNSTTSQRARSRKVWYGVKSRDEGERNKEIGNRRQVTARCNPFAESCNLSRGLLTEWHWSLKVLGRFKTSIKPWNDQTPATTSNQWAQLIEKMAMEWPLGNKRKEQGTFPLAWLGTCSGIRTTFRLPSSSIDSNPDQL